MGKKIRSAKGVMLDFDLMKIKEQIANVVPPVDVKQRQDFVERRLRRRMKKPLPQTTAAIEAQPRLPTVIDEPKPLIQEPASRSKTKKPRSRPVKK
jgi:hypothetical protein